MKEKYKDILFPENRDSKGNKIGSGEEGPFSIL
jgi:hypothetical protein